MAKTETETRIIGNSELIFYPKSHKYKVDGKWVLSVTTVIDYIDKSAALLKWSENLTREFLKEHTGQTLTEDIVEKAVTLYTVKKDEAGDIGTQIHDYIELFVNAVQSKSPMPQVTSKQDEVLNGINGFIDWYDSNDVVFLEGEKTVYSPKYNYVGKFDRIIIINGVKKLVDWKSGKGVYKTVELQLNAYENALFEETGEHIEDLLVLHVDKQTGEFTPHEYKRNPEVLQDFVNFISIKKYK